MNTLLVEPKATEECASALIRGLGQCRYTPTIQLMEGVIHHGPEHVRLRLSCFLAGCTNWQDIKLWVGHPDNLSPFAADPTELFSNPEWLDNTNDPFPDILDG